MKKVKFLAAALALAGFVTLAPPRPAEAGIMWPDAAPTPTPQAPAQAEGEGPSFLDFLLSLIL